MPQIIKEVKGRTVFVSCNWFQSIC